MTDDNASWLRLRITKLEKDIKIDKIFYNTKDKMNDDLIRKVGELSSQLAAMAAEEEFNCDLIMKLSKLLSDSVNAIKGQPPELTHWSTHDLPELVEQVMEALQSATEKTK